MKKFSKYIVLAIVCVLVIAFFGFIVLSANPSIVTKKMEIIFSNDKNNCFKEKEDNCYFENKFWDDEGACIVTEMEYLTNGERYTCQCSRKNISPCPLDTTGSCYDQAPEGWNCSRRF